MKFKIGDTVFYDWIGQAEKVQITKCYPNTNRYQIRHENSYQSTAKASEIFGTENEMWQSKIIKMDNQITSLEKKRDEYKKKMT